MDLSNQTSDTTQRLQGIMPLLQTSGVNPFASSAPYATGSLFNVKQQDDSKAAAAPASAFVQHAPAKAAKGEPETVANSQQVSIAHSLSGSISKCADSVAVVRSVSVDLVLLQLFIVLCRPPPGVLSRSLSHSMLQRQRMPWRTCHTTPTSSWP